MGRFRRFARITMKELARIKIIIENVSENVVPDQDYFSIDDLRAFNNIIYRYQAYLQHMYEELLNDDDIPMHVYAHQRVDIRYMKDQCDYLSNKLLEKIKHLESNK